MSERTEPTLKLRESAWRTIALPVLWDQKSRLICCLSLIAAAAALAGGRFWLLERLLDAGFEKQGTGNVFLFMLIGAVGCWLLGVLALYGSERSGWRLERNCSASIAREYLARQFTLAAENGHFPAAHESAFVTKTILKRVALTVRNSVLTLTRLGAIMATLISATVIHWQLGLISSVVALVSILWAARHVAQQRRGMLQAISHENDFHAELHKFFDLFPILKLYQAGSRWIVKLTGVYRDQKQGEQQSVWAQRRTALEMNVVAALGGIILIIVGARLASSGSCSAAQLMTVVAAHHSIFTMLRMALNGGASVFENSDFLAKFTPEQGLAQASGKPLSYPIRQICGANVTIRLNEQPALSNFSFDLQPGLLYGVDSESMITRTLFLHLLMGIANPREGNLRINGIPITNLNRANISRRISLVSWPPLIIEDTLERNLKVAAPDASPDDLWAALRMVALDSEIRIRHSKEQLSVKLGKKGVLLSTGQQQRLSLARAFLYQPEVLLTEDIFSGLDSQSLSTVLESLRFYSKQHLVLLSTANEEILSRCDKVLNLNSGENSKVARAAMRDFGCHAHRFGWAWGQC